MDGIGILIKDRSDYLVRQLNFYSHTNCRHTIYIGDGSDECHSTKGHF